MKVIDLRHIKSTKQLLLEIDYCIASARYGKEPVIKFLSRSKFACENLRRSLRAWKRQNKIYFIIAGENFREDDERTRFLLDRFPEEKNDSDYGAGNTLATIVCIFSSRSYT